jgi:hypothetical protein
MARNWYRSQQFFWDRKSLVWEYPSKGPDGDQLDVFESMDLEDDLIVYHWVYWGPLVIGTTANDASRVGASA